MLVFAASDPVFGGGACHVESCLRSARSWGLCSAHYQRWKKDGRPPLEVFAATTDPRWQRQRPNARCQAPNCGYGVIRTALCSAHFQRWDRSGRPGLETWLTDAPAVKQPVPGASCLVAHCELWPHGATPFCRPHEAAWRANGRPDIDDFARSFLPRSTTADETIELGKLATQLKLEVQYALQCRRDDRAGKLAPAIVRRAVNFLAEGRPARYWTGAKTSGGQRRNGRCQKTRQSAGSWPTRTASSPTSRTATRVGKQSSTATYG